MCNQLIKYCCLLSILIVSNLCYGQKDFHITIQFVPKIDSSKIVAVFDDGKGIGEFPALFKNGKADINCKVYSKYASLFLLSPENASQKSYFITNEESSIIYNGDNKSDKDYPFINSKLKNAIELTNCKEIKKLEEYTYKERMDFIDFQEKFKTKLKTNDSLNSIYKQKGEIYIKKNLDFIKLNSNQYFYLWYFNFALKGTEFIEVDSLLQYYKEVFYPKYKDLFEAKHILDYLTDRSISESIKINQPAPEFTTTDISGRKFSLSQLRGKFVLINLWATWCGPCVAELPLFKKLRNDFPKNQLEIISLSVDSKKEDMEKGIKKYGLNWTNVFRDMKLVAKYQVSGAIPLTFLIDKEGKLIFMRVGSLSNTDELRKLLMKK